MVTADKQASSASAWQAHRSLTGSFGKTEISVPRAQLQTREGTTEWHSQGSEVISAARSPPMR